MSGHDAIERGGQREMGKGGFFLSARPTLLLVILSHLYSRENNSEYFDLRFVH